MDDRDGQHMGVVTKALVKVVPPSSIILRVLFITCREPGGQGTEVRFHANGMKIRLHQYTSWQYLFFFFFCLISNTFSCG